MAYCSNCGKDVGDNDVFCSGCGCRLINSDETPKDGNIYTGANFEKHEPSQFQKYLYECGDVFKGMLVSPIETIKEMPEKISKDALFILACINIIIYSLLSIWEAKAAFVSISSGLFGGIFGNVSINFNYGKLFIASFVGLVIIYFVLSFFLYFIGKYLLKGEGKPFNYLSIAVISSVPIVYGIFIGIILSYLGAFIALIPISISLIMTILSLYEGFKNEIKLEGSKVVYALASTCVITLIIYTLYLKGINMPGLLHF